MILSAATNRIRFIAFLKRLVLAAVVVICVFAVIQDFLVFPNLWGYPFRYFTLPYQPKQGIRHLLTSSDGTKFELFERQPKNPRAKGAVIVFHGNGDTAQTFASVQEWLASLGLASYTVEFRGYGHSGGWPSESGLYLDAETAWDFVEKKEQLPLKKMLVLAHSVGSGFGAWLAAQKAPGTLVLLSGYSSLFARAKEEPILGFFAPYFLHYKVPTADYLSQLKHTCLVLAHGRNDSIIPFHHAEELQKAYQGPRIITIYSEGGHNDLFGYEYERIGKAILSCLDESEAK